MDGDFQAPEGDSDSKWLKRFTKHPMRWFFAAFVTSNVALLVILQELSHRNSESRPGFPSHSALDVTSTALQAVVGTAVVGASAIVALLVAVAALRASERNNDIAEDQKKLVEHQNSLAGQQNQLAEQQNELSDPDYKLSHAAYGAYRRYGFLAGSLISAYRTFRQERELDSYRPEDVPPPPGARTRPRWDSLLSELREVLLNTPFQVAALEAALVLDRKAAADAGDNKVGDANQHDLRQALTSAVAALDTNLQEVSSGERVEYALAWLLGQIARLDRELHRGLKAVNELPPTADGTSTLVSYLKRWTPLIQSVQLGDDFTVALVTAAFQVEKYAKTWRMASMCASLGLKEIDDSLRRVMTIGSTLPELLESVFVNPTTEPDNHVPWASAPCTDPFGVGLNRAMTVAALLGDHATAIQVRELAEGFAKKHGLATKAVEYISVRGPDDVRRVDPPNADDGRFFILHVTGKTLPLLFDDRSPLNPHTRGCVIVDGIRSVDLGWAEDAAESYFIEFTTQRQKEDEEETQALMSGERTLKGACEPCDTCPACGGCRKCDTCRDEPRDLDIFIHTLARRAAMGGIELPTLDNHKVPVEREEQHIGRNPARDLERPVEDPVPSPRLAWVGIDYRRAGVEPPSRKDNWTFELWSLFSRDSQLTAVSDEVHELTGI